ncbi:MAG TPA: hypothetical protein VH008_30190 [Pseudonocardia sp.]|jgi:hypothetical protein|nr:hypothetical protein [Pseudonocardia sp.]
MTDQRLAGLSHQELWNLAHGGDPAAASTSQANLSKAAQVLENISHTLNAPLAGLGQGWQGRAADAAHGGIGQHAQWAEAAAGRANTAAGQAGQQAASARTVIAEMPPPPSGQPAAGANWAQTEQAQANARQRALELMEQHATECTQTRPTGTFNRPPASGTHGAATGATGGRPTRAGAQGSVRRAPSTNPAAAERGVPGSAGGAGRTVSRAGLEEAPRAAGTGAAPREPLVARTGTRPAAAEPYRPSELRPGAPGLGAAGAMEAAPGRVSGFRAVPGGQSWSAVPGGTAVARTERVAEVPRTLLERPGPGGTPDGPAARASGSEQGRPGLRARGEAEGRQGGQTGGDGAGPGGRGQPGTDAAMLPPVLGGAGYAEQERDQHQRLDYLLDETDVFADNDWVAPPVIGS